MIQSTPALRGAYARAQALYAEMITVLEALGDQSGVAIGLEGVAAVALAQGAPTTFAQAWAAGREMTLADAVRHAGLAPS